MSAKQSRAKSLLIWACAAGLFYVGWLLSVAAHKHLPLYGEGTVENRKLSMLFATLGAFQAIGVVFIALWSRRARKRNKLSPSTINRVMVGSAIILFMMTASVVCAKVRLNSEQTNWLIDLVGSALAGGLGSILVFRQVARRGGRCTEK